MCGESSACAHKMSNIKEKEAKRKELLENLKTSYSKELENSPLGTGWNSLLVLAHAIAQELPFAKIFNITRRTGLLHVVFEPLDNPIQQIILEYVTYKLERESAIVCEHCGKHGFPRTDMAEKLTLCMSCYAIALSDYVEQQNKEVKNVLD